MPSRREFVRAAGVIAAVAGAHAESLLSAGECPMPEQLAEIPAGQHIRIGAMVFPRMDQVDLTGPYAVLSRLPKSSFQLHWKDTGPVRDDHGLGLILDARFAEATPTDLLVIPAAPARRG